MQNSLPMLERDKNQPFYNIFLCCCTGTVQNLYRNEMDNSLWCYEKVASHCNLLCTEREGQGVSGSSRNITSRVLNIQCYEEIRNLALGRGRYFCCNHFLPVHPLLWVLTHKYVASFSLSTSDWNQPMYKAMSLPENSASLWAWSSLGREKMS